jgi:hypothetical protein
MKPNSTQKEYTILMKIDETLPWIELEGIYKTLPDAWRAVERAKKNVKIKLVKSPPPAQEEDILTVSAHQTR